MPDLPAVTMQDLELELAELLPPRETLYRWSAGRPARRLLATAIGLAIVACLAAFWTAGGQFSGW